MIVNITHSGLKKSVTIASDKAGVVTLDGAQDARASYEITASKPAIISQVRPATGSTELSMGEATSPVLTIPSAVKKQITLQHGQDGADGRGVASAVNNPDGTITFSYTDGTSYTSPVLNGPEGPVGPEGPQGVQGPQGIQGIQGPAGSDGAATPSGDPGVVQISGGSQMDSDPEFRWNSTKHFLRLGSDETPKQRLDIEGSINMDRIDSIPGGNHIEHEFVIDENKALVAGNVPAIPEDYRDTGGYRWYVQYIDKYGNHTAADHGSKIWDENEERYYNTPLIPTTACQVRLKIPPHPHANVVKRKIYRNLSSQEHISHASRYYVATINDNTSTEFIDNFSDAEVDDEISGYRLENNTGGRIKIDGQSAMTIDTYITSFGAGSGSATGSSACIGSLSFRYCTGKNNVGVGYHTGSAALSSSNCTFVGSVAGGYTTTGGNGTFIGCQSGRQNTVGHRNTYVGGESGRMNETGHDNVALGYKSLYGNNKNSIKPNSQRMISIGAYAMDNYRTATDTIVIGYNTMRGTNRTMMNTTKSIVIGNGSLEVADSVVDSTIVGYSNLDTHDVVDNVHLFGKELTVPSGKNLSDYMNLCNVITADLGTTRKVSMPRLKLTDLPTNEADAEVGEIWNDNGVLKVKS